MAAMLEVSNLKSWYGESQALHGVDLTVGEGETITILGRNGVGKTTTLRTIMGIIRNRKGVIKLGGKDLMPVPLHRTAKCGLGFVPEERGIFATLSVEENLKLPPVVASGGMTLDEIYELFPNLYERRTSPGTKLSGGEQQMLAMAQNLTHRGQGSAARRADRRACACYRAAHRRSTENTEKPRYDDCSGRAEFPFRQPHRGPFLPDGSWPDGQQFSGGRAFRPHGRTQ